MPLSLFAIMWFSDTDLQWYDMITYHICIISIGDVFRDKSQPEHIRNGLYLLDSFPQT